MSDQCIFCGILDGVIPSAKVYEDETTYAFVDINPATEGHLLVIPKRHSKDLLEIPVDDLGAVAASAQKIARAVVDELGADGVNLLNCCGADAWQTVFHFHMHVIPRYRDKSKDSLVLPWQPDVPGDKEALTAVAKRLSDALG